MGKKYLKIVFELDNSKKRNVTIKNIQRECTDENLKNVSTLVENFIQGTKKETLKVEETKLA